MLRAALIMFWVGSFSVAAGAVQTSVSTANNSAPVVQPAQPMQPMQAIQQVRAEGPARSNNGMSATAPAIATATATATALPALASSAKDTANPAKGYSTYGTLLVTLVVMGGIALRRGGRP